MTRKVFLGGRSDFSIGESILKVDEYVDWAAENGITDLGLCDTMTVSALPKFTQLCQSKNINPIIGARLRCITDRTLRPADKSKKRFMPKLTKEAFVKVWPKNDDGMRDLLELLSQAFTKENFYYVARVQYVDLFDALHRGNLIVTTGDLDGIGRIEDEGRTVFGEMFAAAGVENFYAELTPINTPYFDRTNCRIEDWSFHHGAETILIRPALYKDAQLADSRDVMAVITAQGRQMMDSKFRHIPAYRDLDLDTGLELQSHADAMVERSEKFDGGVINAASMIFAINSIESLAEKVSYTWAKQDVTLPEVYPGDDFDTLRTMCKKGFLNRLSTPVLGYRPSRALIPEYQERLKTELTVIKRMEFSRYFLLIENMVTWSKDNGIIVGPGRGSVGGSLVAYLLGITDVDPIRFDLLFERFINPERIDLPDADLDFQSSRRSEVIKYLVKTYGRDYVAGIANYNTIASGGALRDVGRKFGLDNYQMSVSKLIPAPHGSPVSLQTAVEEVAEIEAFADEHEEVWRHACNLQGVNRALGTHAAGIVVAGEPLLKRAAVQTHKEGEACINWDKRHVEDFGLVKIDVLGLSTLDQIQVCLDMIDEEIDLYKLPLNDLATMDNFGAGRTIGVFQFESSGMRDLLQKLAFGGRLTFEDLAAATSLYRPGPKDSGLLDDYVAIRQGLKLPVYDHPSLEPALSPTNGVMIYQEQVMRVFTDLAGFTLAKADHARKAMGKKDHDKMEALRPEFIKGAAAQGMEEDHANELFQKIIAFASYGFNRSHAVEYSIISYWTMYLKTHYPAQYYAASLSVLKEEKYEGLVADAKEHGIKLMPPDINHSTDRFEVRDIGGQMVMLSPFSSVKGVSTNGAKAIMTARDTAGGQFLSRVDFAANIEARKCNSRAQDSLDKVGAFYEVEPGQLPPLHPDRRRDQMVLMPGLISDFVKADRNIPNDPTIKAMLIGEIVKPCQSCRDCSLSGGIHPTPRLGSKPKFMIVADAPNWSEEAANKMLEGKASNYLKAALKENDLGLTDGYFTSLVKSPKSGKTLSNGQINGCRKYLDKELAILKPPVIVTLGSSSSRALVKDLKGSILDHVGRVVYVPELDASVVIGFNPGMISFDSSKQSRLNEVLRKVKTLVE